MNAAEYFELVDAVTKIDGKTRLRVVADRIATTSMHPLERRVLERALRARGETIALHSQFVMSEIYCSGSSEAKPLAASG